MQVCNIKIYKWTLNDMTTSIHKISKGTFLPKKKETSFLKIRSQFG